MSTLAGHIDPTFCNAADSTPQHDFGKAKGIPASEFLEISVNHAQDRHSHSERKWNKEMSHSLHTPAIFAFSRLVFLWSHLPATKYGASRDSHRIPSLNPRATSCGIPFRIKSRANRVPKKRGAQFNPRPQALRCRTTVRSVCLLSTRKRWSTRWTMCCRFPVKSTETSTRTTRPILFSLCFSLLDAVLHVYQLKGVMYLFKQGLPQPLTLKQR